MNRKKFISGLVALGAAPAVTGSLLDILPAHAADTQNAPEARERAADLKYTANEISQAGADFFGITTEAMAKAVQHIFGDLGEPDAYIKGDEGSGAFIIGLRYGSGYLIRKTRDPIDHIEELLEKKGYADEATLKAIDAEVKRIVADAAEFARTSPEPDPKELYTDVYTVAPAGVTA